MSLYKVGETWYAYVTHGGRRVRRSAGTTDKKEAQRFHDELKASLWSEVQQQPKGRTWVDAVAVWMSLATRSKNDRYTIRSLGLEGYELTEIDDALLAEILSRYKSAGRRNRVRTYIHSILQLAVDRRWIDRIPLMHRSKETPHRVRWLTGDEWERLKAELPPHLVAMASFAVATGLRAGNITGLEWGQIDLSRRVAWVHPDQAKAKQAIGVPLSDAAMDVLLKERGKHKRWVFTYDGNRMCNARTEAWKRAIIRAGLPGLRFHDLRHTWASWHVMSGTPLAVLQKLGGWSSLSMVMRYAHLAPEHLAGYAANATPPRHSWPETLVAA